MRAYVDTLACDVLMSWQFNIVVVCLFDSVLRWVIDNMMCMYTCTDMFILRLYWYVYAWTSWSRLICWCIAIPMSCDVEIVMGSCFDILIDWSRYLDDGLLIYWCSGELMYQCADILIYISITWETELLTYCCADTLAAWFVDAWNVGVLMHWCSDVLM